jgi:hypothetical protein
MTEYTNLRRKNSKFKYLKKFFEFFKDYENLIVSYEILLNDVNITLLNFQKNILKKYNMVACGKPTKLFWLQRGYTLDESIVRCNEYKVVKDKTKSPMNINFWLNKGFSEEDAKFKIKSQRKLNIEYWLNKGFSEEDAKLYVREFQLEQNNKYVKKRKNNPDKYNAVSETQLKYWLNKGFSEEEGKIKLKERQRTFSKDICIKKYGDELGLIKWKERQDKWINSLILSDYDLSSKKSVTTKYKINNYNIDKLIDSYTLINKELFKELFKKCKNIEEFVTDYSNHFNNNNLDEISLYNIIKPIQNLTILSTYYNTDNKHILSLIIPKITRIKSRYSYISWFNGHICRSDSEYIIANYLFKNNINYVYEKYYKNSNKRCDFYLTDYNLYVEFFGMTHSYKTKIDFLNINNINYLSDRNRKKLIEKIDNYVNNTNK